MHSASFDTSSDLAKDGGEVLVAIAALVTEVRIPGTHPSTNCKTKGFYEGPHCPLNKNSSEHRCDLTDFLCSTFGNVRDQVLDLWQRNIPVCLEVLLGCACQDKSPHDFLLEKWYFTINHRRSAEPLYFNFVQLMHAIRSQLYFSQLTAWLTIQEETGPCRITNKNLRYRLSLPGETFESAQFTLSAVKHEFPLTDIGNGCTANVSFLSLPRMTTMPSFVCEKCAPNDDGICLVDDRMHTNCTLKGKHRCEDFEDVDTIQKNCRMQKRLCQNEAPSTSKSRLHVDIHRANLLNSHKTNDLMVLDKGKMLLDAIERTGYRSKCDKCKDNDNDDDGKCVQNIQNTMLLMMNESCSDNGKCDKMSESDISSIKQNNNIIINNNNNTIKKKVNVDCDKKLMMMKDVTNIVKQHNSRAKKKITFDNDSDDDDNNDKMKSEIPTPLEQARFRKDLDNAANMVFHSRTGLPLTSSPAPVRRGKSCFDFDSSINSVSAIKSALFSTSFSTDDESESDGSIVSPCSPETCVVPKRDLTPVKYRRKGHAANLLGSFEESVLNGRLEPVSTVHGFSAELGASGSFVPKHLVVPVTVFFYTLGDNDKVSSPYLSHINLGRKGYNVPKCGTIQVTLFNPLGTVVKMFVIMYDLSDMPANSQTFIRQRTFYMPTNLKDEWGPKWLRYLIHLRFISSKSGKIYLHSDIRMIIFRKSDMDTATAHGIDKSYELRSFTHMPINPRFSPRK